MLKVTITCLNVSVILMLRFSTIKLYKYICFCVSFLHNFVWSSLYMTGRFCKRLAAFVREHYLNLCKPVSPLRFFWLLHFLNFEKGINKGSGDIQDCYGNTMLTKCRQIYACMLLGERKLHLHSAHVVHISINTHGEDQWKHPLGAQGSCGHPNHWKHFSLREFGIAETHTKCSSTHANKLTVTVKNVLKNYSL